MQVRTNSDDHQGCKNYNIVLAVGRIIINRGSEQLFEMILLFLVTELCHYAHICSHSYDKHVPPILVPSESGGYWWYSLGLV